MAEWGCFNTYFCCLRLCVVLYLTRCSFSLHAIVAFLAFPSPPLFFFRCPFPCTAALSATVPHSRSDQQTARIRERPGEQAARRSTRFLCTRMCMRASDANTQRKKGSLPLREYPISAHFVLQQLWLRVFCAASRFEPSPFSRAFPSAMAITHLLPDLCLLLLKTLMPVHYRSHI